VIGICAAIDRARWAVWDVEANVSQRTYSRAVVNAGGLPVILPPHREIADDPGAVIRMPGGTDLDPRLYGAEADERTTGISPERDAFELALMQRALEVEIPLLAICRGMQLLNVALGGTLEQHIPGAERHLHTPGVFSDHEVRLEPGSLVAAAAGAEKLQVSSHHHQGIGRLGRGLRVTGYSVPDGIAEAIELTGGDHAIGILWHTEEEQRSPLVADLVVAAREHAGRRDDAGVAS
jgi:putative glutamine amidotransferase